MLLSLIEQIISRAHTTYSPLSPSPSSEHLSHAPEQLGENVRRRPGTAITSTEAHEGVRLLDEDAEGDAVFAIDTEKLVRKLRAQVCKD